MLYSSCKKVSLCTLIIVAFLFAGTASAAALEEVVVTAQKREQNVQDVPITISAFSKSAMQARGIDEVSALAHMTPNVTLDGGTPFSGSSAILAGYIRGIGQNDFAMNFDPGVGVYVDGVYLARSVGANLSLPDVERVEILKGPQGTLFGRNTIGGAINIVTRTPGDEFAAEGEITTGHFNRLDMTATMDLPITDSLRSSLTYQMQNRDPYQKRIDYPSASPVNTDPNGAFINPDATYPAGFETSSADGGIDEWTFRGKLQWDVSDRITATVSGDYTLIDQTAMPNTILATTENDPSSLAGIYNACINLPPAVTSGIFNNACTSRGTAIHPSTFIGGFAGVNVDANPNNDRLPYDNRFITDDIDKTYATGPSFTNMTSYGITGTIDWDLTDNIKIKSITAYRDLDWNTGLDLDGSPLDILGTTPTFQMVQDQFSQELQLTGDAYNGDVNYVIGAYYFEESGRLQDTVNFSQGLLQIFGPNDLDTENWAIFGQLDWRINDLFGVTLGGRYTEEDKTFLGGQTDLNGFSYKLAGVDPSDPNAIAAARPVLGFPVPGQPLRYFIDEVQKKSFSNFDPRVGVQVYPMEDLMVFASYSTGFKTGGWTTRLSAPLDYAPDFNEEKATAWELGVKSQMFDNRMQVNAAVFTTKYEDIQLNFQQGVSPTIQNAGDARITGFELEVNAAPTDRLSILSSLGYIDAHYTSVLPGAQVLPNQYQAGVVEDAELPKTPEWSFNFSPSYQFPLANGGQLTLTADYTYTSEIWNDTERTYLLQRESTHRLNSSLTYTSPGGSWDVVVGGTNILDERYIVTGQAQIAGGQIYGTYSRPAEWYATVRYRY